MRKLARFLRKIAAVAPLAAGLVLYSTNSSHSHRNILHSPSFRSPQFLNGSSSSIASRLASPFSVVAAKESAEDTAGEITRESAGGFTEESARDSIRESAAARPSIPPEDAVKSQKRRKINQLLDLVDTSDCKEDHRGAHRLLAEFTTPYTDDPKVRD